jgi:uncharacterized protein (TIGR00369 family)
MAAMDASSLLDAMPFSTACGVEVAEASAAEVRGGVAWDPGRCTTNGILHGGLLMAVADSLGAVCAVLNLPEGAGTATIESKTNFFRAVRRGYVHVVSRPLHVGRTTITVQTALRDDEDRLLAQTTQTQAVLT